MQLVFENVWQELLKHWTAGPRFVAAAYFSESDGLNFSPNDVLVVDASDGSIRSGQTCAKALRLAVAEGARVYSHPDLHAKIYVLGQRVFVGSANASRNARENLIECMGMSDEPHSVAAAIAFIDGLSIDADRVDEEFLRRIESLPVNRPLVRSRAKRVPNVAESKYWLMGLSSIDYPGDVEARDRTSDRLQDSLEDGTEAQWFWLPHNATRIVREGKPGDIFINVWREKPKRDARGVRVYPPAVIHHVEHEDGRKIFHYAQPANADSRYLTWRQFQNLFREAGWEAQPSIQACRIIPRHIGQWLSKRWPP